MNLIDYIKEKYDVEELKKQFNNVYFIIGTAYAGKSTMVKMLSEYYDGIMCGENYTTDYFEEYGVNKVDQPSLSYFDDHTMEEFVSRSPDEYCTWLDNCDKELTPIEIWHLNNLTNKYPDKKIFVDTNIPLEILKLISSYDNVVVMLSEQSMSIDRFFDREDFEKQIIYKAIMNTEDPEATMANYRKVLEKANSKEKYDHLLNSGFYVFKRDDMLTLEETMKVLAKHFKLD